MKVMQRLRRSYWILSVQFGMDPIKGMKAVLRCPRYLVDAIRFRRRYVGSMECLPCLHDRLGEGGSARDEYFWQDLLVARKIHARAPKKHVDIGSRIDGFVAHVAGFRELEVIDIRPITAVVPGVTFRAMDFMDERSDLIGYADSVSCLHALEHFGLGRYNDPLNPDGFRLGFANLAKLVTSHGILYLSVPIGRERVVFNAHRVFDPRTILSLAGLASLSLTSLVVVKDGSYDEYSASRVPLDQLATLEYALGIFIFEKS